MSGASQLTPLIGGENIQYSTASEAHWQMKRSCSRRELLLSALVVVLAAALIGSLAVLVPKAQGEARGSPGCVALSLTPPHNPPCTPHKDAIL